LAGKCGSEVKCLFPGKLSPGARVQCVSVCVCLSGAGASACVISCGYNNVQRRCLHCWRYVFTAADRNQRTRNGGELNILRYSLCLFSSL